MAKLSKVTPPPVFPKLGVPDDRRETPIVDNARSVATKLVGAAATIPKDKREGMSLQRLAAEEFMPPQPGMSMASEPGTQRRLSYALGDQMRERFSRGAAPEPKAPVATVQHENFHMLMNRLQEKIGGPRMRALAARDLYLSIPPQDRTYADRFTFARNEHTSHGENPFHPQHYEEKIAIMLNHLNNPAERDRYSSNVDDEDRQGVARRTSSAIKSAMRHMRNYAAAMTPESLKNVRPLTAHEERYLRAQGLKKSTPHERISKLLALGATSNKSMVQKVLEVYGVPKNDPRRRG